MNSDDADKQKSYKLSKPRTRKDQRNHFNPILNPHYLFTVLSFVASKKKRGEIWQIEWCGELCWWTDDGLWPHCTSDTLKNFEGVFFRVPNRENMGKSSTLTGTCF